MRRPEMAGSNAIRLLRGDIGLRMEISAGSAALQSPADFVMTRRSNKPYPKIAGSYRGGDLDFFNKRLSLVSEFEAILAV